MSGSPRKVADFSLAIADRHLVWKGYDYFAVIPHYASLLREIFAGDFSNDDWVGGLVTSHLCRFHFDTHRDSIPSIVRAVDHHLACLMVGYGAGVPR